MVFYQASIVVLGFVLAFISGFKIGYDKKKRVERLIILAKSIMEETEKAIHPPKGQAVEWVPPVSQEDEAAEKVLEDLHKHEES